jgi:hypothetical protein
LTRITVNVHEALYIFMIISLGLLFRMTNVSDKDCRENQNTHFMLNYFYQTLCHLWDNVEKFCIARQATDDNTIGHRKDIGISGNTFAFPHQQWLCKGTWMLCDVHCLSCLWYYSNIFLTWLGRTLRNHQ